MLFDPRIIPADDAPLDDDGSLLLPADLSELANQLRDDANYLANQYPAKSASQANLPPAGNRRFYPYPLFAAASLFLVACCGWLVWSRSEIREPAAKIVTVPFSQTADNAALKTRYKVENTPSFPVSFEQPNLEGLLLYELSGPELEGVYDLLTETPQQEISF